MFADVNVRTSEKQNDEHYVHRRLTLTEEK